MGLASCSLPRGAAMQSEILKDSNSEEPTFDVVAVTRANIPSIKTWPKTGNSMSRNWISASRGSNVSVIRSGDFIDLSIWDSQENSLLSNVGERTARLTKVLVEPNGTIFVPYVGNHKVAGSTPASARASIQRRLEAIVPSAQVQLSMTAGQANSVDLVSGVARPGSYPMPSLNYSILSLIAHGGGISGNLKYPVVRLMRGGKSYTILAEELLSSASQNTILRGGDKVLVEEDDRSFTALGATGQERLVTFPEETLTAMEALALIGGISDNVADPRGVLVLREYKPKQTRKDGHGPKLPQVIFTIDLTSADGLFAARKFQINPGDTVLATESPIGKARTILGLFGSVLGVSAQSRAIAR